MRVPVIFVFSALTVEVPVLNMENIKAFAKINDIPLFILFLQLISFSPSESFVYIDHFAIVALLSYFLYRTMPFMHSPALAVRIKHLFLLFHASLLT